MTQNRPPPASARGDASPAGSRLTQWLDFAPDAIVAIDDDGRIAVVNRQTERLFGYARSELIGESVELLVPERFRAAHAGHRGSYFADPKMRPMGAGLKLFGLRHDGTEFPAEISLSSIETDEGELAIAAVRDVSDQVRAERRFEQLLDAAPDAFVGVDTGGRIVLVNRQTENVFGYPRSALLNRPVEMLLPERFREAHEEQREGYFADPRTRPMGGGLRLYGMRADGTEFPAAISLSSIETEQGLVATAAIRDITIDVEREREAQTAREAQASRLESLGQLAGGISHDFNNLLSVIINYAAFVADELSPDSPIQDDVREIRRAGERAAELTRQLLVFSRREVVRPEALALNDVVGEMERLLRRTLGEHIQLSTSFSPDLHAIMADPGQIEQVLVNLAINARDAMPNGGQLHIETTNVELDEEFAMSHPDTHPGPHVRLTVADNGVGMPREVVERAFDPFFSTKPKGHGTGLGLATVYGIVKQAGGTVALYSEPGRGTVCKVHLPAAAGAALHVRGAPPATTAGHGERILVVEDEDAVRRMATRILESHGYDVTSSDSASQALALVTSGEPFNLLLSDVVMPEMLGIELGARVGEVAPGLPVLYMSGYIDPLLNVEHASLDAERFIEKPFSGTALLTSVRRALDATAH